VQMIKINRIILFCAIGILFCQFALSPLLQSAPYFRNTSVQTLSNPAIVCDSDQYVLSSSEKNSLKEDSIPSSWDWRDAEHEGIRGDWTTPAKNQRNRCYAFTILGSLESIIKIREKCVDFTPDLSEQYLISHYTYDDFLKNRSGVTVFEECCPYKGLCGINLKYHLFNITGLSPDWEKYCIPVSNFSVTVRTSPPLNPEERRNELKSLILENGPIGLRIYAPGMSVFTVGSLRNWGLFHRGPNDYYSGEAPAGVFNQAVVLAGWKDDLMIPNGGYWIIKNSWGSLWGCDGFFNLEYGSLNSDCGYYIRVDYDPSCFNWPPMGSPVLVAPSHVNSEKEYRCSFSSIDPEENQFNYQGEVYYNFSFGDYTFSGWLGPYKSGEQCSVFHVWSQSGSVDIKVKARDDPDGDGDFSDGAETYWMS